MPFEDWACKPKINPAIVIAEGECLLLLATVESGPAPPEEVLEAAARAFESGGLEPAASLGDQRKAAQALALALGGLVLVSLCPPGPPTPIARLYKPNLMAPERSLGYLGDRGVIEAFTEAARGGDPWRGIEGKVAVAPLGIECLPPYAART